LIAGVLAKARAQALLDQLPHPGQGLVLAPRGKVAAGSMSVSR
jgi:hypothetical protein